MAIKLSATAANAGLDAVIALLDETEHGVGILQFYSDSEGTEEMCTIDFESTAFAAAGAGSADDGVSTMNGLPKTAAMPVDLSPGTAMIFVKAYQCSGSDPAVYDPIFSATVGITGSGADITMPNNVFYAGESVSISTLSLELTPEIT